MLKAKKPVKITKKEIKEDSFFTFYAQVLAFYYKFQKEVIIGLGVVVAAILIYVLVWINNQSNESEAAELFGKVHQYVEQANYELALNGDPAKGIIGLKEIADNYGGTASGELATYYAGEFSYLLAKYDDAEKYFDDVNSDDPLIQAAAIAGYAATLEIKNENKDAAKKYKKAALLSKNDATTPRYLYLAGLNYAQAKEFDDAVDCFKEIKEDYEKSSYAKDADKYIAMYSKN